MYVVEHWTIGNVIRYTWKVVKCDAGERLTYCARNEPRRRGISYILRMNCLLKDVIEVKMEGRLDY